MNTLHQYCHNLIVTIMNQQSTVHSRHLALFFYLSLLLSHIFKLKNLLRFLSDQAKDVFVACTDSLWPSVPLLPPLGSMATVIQSLFTLAQSTRSSQVSATRLRVEALLGRKVIRCFFFFFCNLNAFGLWLDTQWIEIGGGVHCERQCGFEPEKVVVN